MSTLVVGHHPEIEDWLSRRRELGQDGHDEVWRGVVHVAPHQHSRNTYRATQLSVLLHERAVERGLRSAAL